MPGAGSAGAMVKKELASRDIHPAAKNGRSPYVV
jgi:hypothetical protein